jgi:hypothetical protein
MPEIQKTVLHKKKNYLAWPLNDGFKLESDYTKIIKHKLQFLLSVNIRERLGNLGYGTNMWQWVFSNFSDIEIATLGMEISSMVKKHLPEVSITNFKINTPQSGNNTVVIKIDFEVPTFDEYKDTITIGI